MVRLQVTFCMFFRACTPLKGKPSDPHKDLHELLKLLRNFEVNLTLSQGDIVSFKRLSTAFATPCRDVVRLQVTFYIFFKASTPFKGKPSDPLKDLHDLKLSRNFEVNLTLSQVDVVS